MTVKQDNHARQIQTAGRTIRCNSTEDRALLAQSQSMENNPGAVDEMGIGRLSHSAQPLLQQNSEITSSPAN
ncbi:MAG: hypothetical protein C0485_13940 [Pirellula sp.]|nr:hypothetical protein [Pirellula sp.]